MANTLLAGTKMPPANARLILDAYFDADRDWNIAVRATFERFEDLCEIIRFTEDHHRCQAGLGYEFLISSATPGSMILPAYVEQDCKGTAEDGFDGRKPTARDVMTAGTHCCREDDDLAKAMRHMEELKF